ncbi:hypothetical protein ABMA10_16140 [Plantibacter sp. RU18]
MLHAAATESSHLGQDLIILGVLFVIAYILGRLGKLIGLPSIPVYMLVGLLASPYTGWFPLDFASDQIELIAVFGLILLLFNLGLEFDQDEFFGNAGKFIVSGGSYILVNMAAGLVFGFLVGWGTREALIIAGITATSSSAIVTKLLIELKRLTNDETPMILGVTVVEDIFIAIYLAIVGVVLSGETAVWPVIGKLAIAFTFILVMFAVARFGGRFVSRLFRTKDDELFTILFFGLAVAFGGIGELLGVTDAIGAFLIGLVLGATRFRNKIEQIAIPLRDVFGAFFFLNFGLALDASKFGSVLVPVLLAVLMTVVLNVGAGQFVAWLNGLGPQAGINAAVILQNRGGIRADPGDPVAQCRVESTHPTVRGPLRAHHGDHGADRRGTFRADRCRRPATTEEAGRACSTAGPHARRGDRTRREHGSRPGRAVVGVRAVGCGPAGRAGHERSGTTSTKARARLLAPPRRRPAPRHPGNLARRSAPSCSAPAGSACSCSPWLSRVRSQRSASGSSHARSNPDRSSRRTRNRCDRSPTSSSRAPASVRRMPDNVSASSEAGSRTTTSSWATA